MGSMLMFLLLFLLRMCPSTVAELKLASGLPTIASSSLVADSCYKTNGSYPSNSQDWSLLKLSYTSLVTSVRVTGIQYVANLLVGDDLSSSPDLGSFQLCAQYSPSQNGTNVSCLQPVMGSVLAIQAKDVDSPVRLCALDAFGFSVNTLSALSNDTSGVSKLLDGDIGTCVSAFNETSPSFELQLPNWMVDPFWVRVVRPTNPNPISSGCANDPLLVHVYVSKEISSNGYQKLNGWRCPMLRQTKNATIFDFRCSCASSCVGKLMITRMTRVPDPLGQICEMTALAAVDSFGSWSLCDPLSCSTYRMPTYSSQENCTLLYDTNGGGSVSFQNDQSPAISSQLAVLACDANSARRCQGECVAKEWCCAAAFNSATGKCGLLFNGSTTIAGTSSMQEFSTSSSLLSLTRAEDQLSRCCAEVPSSSIKYSYWNALNLSALIDGPISAITMNFSKAFSHTDLRVVFTSDVGCKSGGPCRFYFKVNNQECSNPAPLEMIIYNSAGPNLIYWTGYMERICRGIPKGNVAFSLYSDSSIGPSSTGSRSIGLIGSTRLMVEEMEVSKTTTASACPAQANVNVQQFTTGINSDTDQGVVYTTNYAKRLNETGMKMTFVGVLRVRQTSCNPPNTVSCARWELLIDGASCSNPSRIGGFINMYGPCQNHHYTSSFKGICIGVPAGTHVITLIVTTCDGTSTAYDAYTSHIIPSNILVEEVRLGTAFQHPSVTAAFNLLQYSVNMNSDIDNGTLTSTSYTKQRSDTALRVSWTSNMQQHTTGTEAVCSRSYITFNNQECTSPGPIDLIFYMNPGVAFYDGRLGRNFGICRGIPAGNVVIGVRIGSCPGVYTLGDALTSDRSFLIVDEVFEQT